MRSRRKRRRRKGRRKEEEEEEEEGGEGRALRHLKQGPNLKGVGNKPLAQGSHKHAAVYILFLELCQIQPMLAPPRYPFLKSPVHIKASSMRP